MPNPDKQPEPPKQLLFSLSQLVDVAAEDAKKRYEDRQANKPLGVKTPFSALNYELGGSLAIGCHILHASPGAGKSALALQIAATCGQPSLYVTCEMPAVELMRRLAARVNSIRLNKFRNGSIEPLAARTAFKLAAQEAPMLSILDATESPLNTDTLYAMVGTLREKFKGNAEHFLVVVDSVQAWSAGWGENSMPEYERLNLALDWLKALGHRFAVPVIGIAERNRQKEKAGGQSASAGSRRFEYGAETVMELDKKDVGAKIDQNGEIECRLKLSKNRNGRTDVRFDLLWHGAYQRFQKPPSTQPDQKEED